MTCKFMELSMFCAVPKHPYHPLPINTNTHTKNILMNWASLKLKTFALLTSLKNKDKPEAMKRYLQIIDPRKDLNLEYIKNSKNNFKKRQG